MKNYVIAALSGAALILSGQVVAADIEAGKTKAAEVCASCHGLDGNSPAPAFPKINLESVKILSWQEWQLL